MSKIVMSFELDENWKPYPDHPHQHVEFLFWKGDVGEPPRYGENVAASVREESLGEWAWSAFRPCGHQADASDKEATREDAKTAALEAIYRFANPNLPKPQIDNLDVPSIDTDNTANQIIGHLTSDQLVLLHTWGYIGMSLKVVAAILERSRYDSMTRRAMEHRYKTLVYAYKNRAV